MGERLVEWGRFALLASLWLRSLAWPDGAPCLRKIVKSMTPEAREHHGGLRHGPPPYRLYVRAGCYQEGVPIELLLESMTDVQFKGFVVQPWNTRTKERTGTFTRDDNGSWKYQCFKERASITHSHNTPKTKLEVSWMETDYHGDDIQFVATVVERLDSFWVQTLRSDYVPHCNTGRQAAIPSADERFTQRNFRPVSGPFTFGREDEARRFIDTDSEEFRNRLTTTSSPSVNLPDWCVDKEPHNCPGWAQFCHSDPYTTKNCERTCKICSKALHDEMRGSGRSSSASSSRRQPSSGGGSLERACRDEDPSCPDWRDSCRDPNSYASKHCQRTCGNCASGSGECRDADTSCGSWRSLCSSDPYVQSKCHRTCGRGPCAGLDNNRVEFGRLVLPNSPSLVPSIPAAISCEDKHAQCSQWRRQCDRDDWVRRNCERTCGRCESARRSQFLGGSSGCSDNPSDRISCPGWANAGRCHSDDYVMKNCRRSCDLCPGHFVSAGSFAAPAPSPSWSSWPAPAPAPAPSPAPTSAWGSGDKDPNCKGWHASCYLPHIAAKCPTTCG